MTGTRIATIPSVLVRSLTSAAGETRAYYLGTLTSDKIKDLTFVPVIDESPRSYLSERSTDGYQRYGSTSRMS